MRAMRGSAGRWSVTVTAAGAKVMVMVPPPRDDGLCKKSRRVTAGQRRPRRRSGPGVGYSGPAVAYESAFTFRQILVVICGPGLGNSAMVRRCSAWAANCRTQAAIAGFMLWIHEGQSGATRPWTAGGAGRVLLFEGRGLALIPT